MDVADEDLNLESVRTMVTTIVSLGPPNHDARLLSENLLEFDPNSRVPRDNDMRSLRTDFHD